MLQGNFAATLVLRPQAPADQAALRSFVAALALDEAFTLISGRSEAFTLKWPNDVLLNGGKVAGILLESSGVSAVEMTLAIGVGVNLARAPQRSDVEERATPPVSLVEETGVVVPPEDFLTYLAIAFEKYETILKTYGFDPIRTAWLTRAARLGETITARTSHDSYEGTFETVDEAGALVLKTAKGRVAIPAAEIYF